MTYSLLVIQNSTIAAKYLKRDDWQEACLACAYQSIKKSKFRPTFTKKLKKQTYFKIKPIYSIPVFQCVDFSQVLLYGSLQTSVSNVQGFLFFRLCLVKYFPFFFFFMESFFEIKIMILFIKSRIISYNYFDRY